MDDVLDETARYPKQCPNRLDQGSWALEHFRVCQRTTP